MPAAWALRRQSSFIGLLALVGVTMAGACSPTDHTATSPESANNASLVNVSGAGQTAFAGDSLQSPVVMIAKDVAGKPVAGARVRFTVVSGAGYTTDSVRTTDATGLCSTEWHLGGVVGAQTLSVALDTGKSAPVEIVAQAFSPSSANVIVASGATQGAISVVIINDWVYETHVLTWPDTVLRLIPHDSGGDWQEVDAYNVGHQPVSMPNPWTSTRDTVRLNFAPAVAVPITVWILDSYGTTLTRVQQDLSALDAFWRSAPLGLTVGATRIIDSSTYAGPALDCVNAPPFADSTTVNVYYSSIPPFTDGGYNCNPRTILMASRGAAGTRLLAHEFGHAFGLGVVSDPQNVMWEFAPAGPGLYTGQAFAATFIAGSALNTIYRFTPAIGVRNCIDASHCMPPTFSIW